MDNVMDVGLGKGKYAPGGVMELLGIALPMMASSASDTLMTFISRMFLAKLGPEQMNASLTGGMMVFLMVAFFVGLIGYGTALVAQYFGAKQRKNCAIVISQGIIIALVAYPLILLLAPVCVKVFESSGIARVQLDHQITYFNILIYGSIFSLLRGAYSCFFVGIGRARIVMISSVVTMLVSIAANYVLVFGKLGFPAMGIRGSAYAVIVAGLFGLLVLLIEYYFGKDAKECGLKGSFRFDRSIMYKLFKYGYPAGLEFLLTMAAFTWQITLFQSRGQVVATAATITYNWDMVAYVPLVGIEIAITSLVGRYVGARQLDNAHSSTISGLKIGFIYSVFIFATFLIFPMALINFFRPSNNIAVFNSALPLTLFMVRLMAVYVLFESVILAFCGALRGAGDTFWAMFINVVLHWIMVGMLYVLFNVFNVSAKVGWVFIITWIMLLGLAFYLRYRTGKWKEIELIQQLET